MAIDRAYDIDEDVLPRALKYFMRKRLMELSGVMLLAILAAVSVSLATWNINDPSFNHAVSAAPKNWLGYPGAVVADQLMQFFGLGTVLGIGIPLVWVTGFFAHRGPEYPKTCILFWMLSVILACAAIGCLPIVNSWPLASGYGGTTGYVLATNTVSLLSIALKGFLADGFAFLTFACASIWCIRRSTGSVSLAGGGAGLALLFALRFMAHYIWSFLCNVVAFARQSISAMRENHRNKLSARRIEPDTDIIARLAPVRKDGRRMRREPDLIARNAGRGNAGEIDGVEDAIGSNFEEVEEGAEESAPKVAQRVSKLAPRKHRGKIEIFELPSVELLTEPKKPPRGAEISKDVLEENARTLEGVLDDFGVKGQIINVRPGPVVTLYELEPAPGIKSSRVISLADDIARSMSAISARVAVVSGRNAIGIELPNARRETVYLRELVSGEAFTESKQSLCLALGKNIGGEPIFADLARMPHLLIAGTTGSGKSVGINTMILSLLYRLSPERCRLIMIDPKMLELSVYEGIPHLLAPVVTDPRKAVVALKWAVREMEERYKRMSKIGVRNVDGFNARMEELVAKGEKLKRTVQTGFEPETGKPIFETEESEPKTLPYIVVIIDEMADLMMVAGKDIEGAVQRLAQMARAAGIHVVMATQRPSVDVITGTIKANFPTRISFQVTSKIDSRTILGEQGAEQLLGQGDMLYMAGGGRISRLHAPFVSDAEVEAIVSHLKLQAAPEYVEAVTEEQDDDGQLSLDAGIGSSIGSGDELYDQAVAVVLRDKKVSTSYIQRRLQVGYNKAASLIERMENEGLISSANATGKREILVPGDSARD